MVVAVILVVVVVVTLTLLEAVVVGLGVVAVLGRLGPVAGVGVEVATGLAAGLWLMPLHST